MIHFFNMFILFISCQTTKTDVTWTRDIQPIVEQNCVRCHNAQGQGTGDFTDYETVKTLADSIITAIDMGTMPPPAADPNCHSYLDSDKMHLQTESRNQIARWIENETPYGREEDAKTYDRTEITLQDPDLIVKLKAPYVPSFDNEENLGNDYRCFSIEHNQTETFYITDLHPTIDQKGLVHHIVLAKATDAGILEGSTEPDGVDCINGASFVSGDFSEFGMLGAWAPGMSPVRLDDNAGMLVQPDEYIVLQIHYFLSDNVPINTPDQSGYAFNITKEAPEHVIQMAPLGITDINIPAGEEAHTLESSFSLPLNVNLWGVFPHMHILGDGYQMKIGDQCIVESDKYDFNNQLTYMFSNPIEITAGEEISWSCTWNNSTSNPNLIHSPPIDVNYGERTDEEMCFAFSLISF